MSGRSTDANSPGSSAWRRFVSVSFLLIFAGCPAASLVDGGATEPTAVPAPSVPAIDAEVAPIDAGATSLVLPPGFDFNPTPPEDDGSCEKLRSLKSRCARDLDCELVDVGCGAVAVGPADLDRARELSTACERFEHLCPASVSPTRDAPLCVKQRCTTREVPNDVRPEQLCLDRAIERAPRDRKPVVVEVTPGSGRQATAVARDDTREVARCIERVLSQSLWAPAPLTLRYTPGEVLERARKMPAASPPPSTPRPGRPMTTSVTPPSFMSSDGGD